MNTQHETEYSPEAIRFWLGGRLDCSRGCHWSMLESATEGATGCTGMGSGRGDRLALVLLKADLERAADNLPIHFQSTAFVFARQHRLRSLYQRRQMASPQKVAPVAVEDPRPSVALDRAIYAMAYFLGWQEGQAA